MDPPPGVAPSWLAYRARASLEMLWGLEKWSARDDLHVQGCLILSQVGLLFPVNHAPMKLASLTGFAPVISCMRGRHVGWTTPQGPCDFRLPIADFRLVTQTSERGAENRKSQIRNRK